MITCIQKETQKSGQITKLNDCFTWFGTKKKPQHFFSLQRWQTQDKHISCKINLADVQLFTQKRGYDFNIKNIKTIYIVQHVLKLY